MYWEFTIDHENLPVYLNLEDDCLDYLTFFDAHLYVQYLNGSSEPEKNKLSVTYIKSKINSKLDLLKF